MEDSPSRENGRDYRYSVVRIRATAVMGDWDFLAEISSGDYNGTAVTELTPKEKNRTDSSG